MYILMVDLDDGSYDPPELFGPFDALGDAQAFAEDFREVNGLPREATNENSEAWTLAGWYFGIVQPQTACAKWGQP